MSQINTDRIDALFPIQGQDNSSQGFRNNFLYIKQGLTTAKVEISELENISAKLNEDNDFNGYRLENVIVNRISESFKNNGNVGGVSVEVDVIESQIQKIKFIANSTVRFTGWPNIGNIAKNYKIRLHLSGDGLNDYEIIFSTDSQGTIKYAGDGTTFPSPFTMTTNEKVIDVWSYDGGVTVFVKYLGEFI
jgi:hypothetical protein